MTGYHQPLQLVDRPAPEPARPTDVMVRIGGAGVCATDLHAIDALMEQAGVAPPRILGHENAGWVEAVGGAVTTVRPGDAVILYPPQTCGLCLACRRGLEMQCERHEFTGLSVDGGFAELLRVPERSLLRLPDGVEPAAVAPHADAGLTAYHAVRRVAHLAHPGTTSVILGVGGVGHVAVQLMRILGAGRVIASETDERRRKLALELGADAAVDGREAVAGVRDLTGGIGADIVLDFVGTDRSHGDGLAMLGRSGTYSIVGYGGTVTSGSVALVVNEQTITGNLVGSWVDLWELIQLHATGRLALRTERHPLESVNEVIDRLRAGDIVGRAVLVP
jgi:NAD+-dependent secondary alcohol dehydrogenase Adh1